MHHDYGLAPTTSCTLLVYIVPTLYMCLIWVYFFSPSTAVCVIDTLFLSL